jgi:hypothetical protein
MSINVEMIGTGLVIQHYVYEIAEKQHCHMVSLSDVLTPHGWTPVQVIWDLTVKDNGDGTLQYTNSVTSHPTTEFMAFNEKNGVTFEETVAARQATCSDHNRRETPCSPPASSAKPTLRPDHTPVPGGLQPSWP